MSHRNTSPEVVSGYHGDFVETIVADPLNYRHIFVVDTSSQVWASSDAGQTFQIITANLVQLAGYVLTLEVVRRGPWPADVTLVAGGLNGVFAVPSPGSASQPWSQLGNNLPHVMVDDLHYYPNSHLLLAGTQGRGAWTLSNPFGASADSRITGASPAASPALASSSPAPANALFISLTGGLATFTNMNANLQANANWTAQADAYTLEVAVWQWLLAQQTLAASGSMADSLTLSSPDVSSANAPLDGPPWTDPVRRAGPGFLSHVPTKAVR